MTEQRKPSSGTVPSVARATRVLTTIADDADGIALSDLARRIQAPKTSVLSICTTLVEAGFLVKESDRYKLGLGVVKLGRSYAANSDAATEFWRTNAERPTLLNETIVLSVLDGVNVVYVGCRKGARPVAVSYEIGLTLPAHCTASGKAMLSKLPRSVIEELYGARNLRSLTEKSVTSLSDLLPHIGSAAQRGFAIDDEETARGMRCYGVALADATGRPVCAVSVSTVKAAYEQVEVTQALQEIGDFAARLAERLGLPQPAPIRAERLPDYMPI